MDLTEEQKAMLTPGELDALAESEFTDEEMSAMKAIAGDDDDEDGSDDDGKVSDAAGTAPEASASSDVDTADAAPARAPRYQAALPDDFADRSQALISAEATAWEKFDGGELDRSELQRELSRISDERASLHKLEVKAEISQEMGVQTAEQEWRSTVTDFVSSVASAIDYRKDEAKQRDLDQFVKVLGADESHADKPMRWFLEEAHKRVMALHGMSAEAPAGSKDAKKMTESKNRKPDFAGLPKTLAHVPGASEDVRDEFADLDGLTGLDAEMALSRMSPSQRAKYLSAA